jgi:hypothetical protein
MDSDEIRDLRWPAYPATADGGEDALARSIARAEVDPSIELPCGARAATRSSASRRAGHTTGARVSAGATGATEVSAATPVAAGKARVAPEITAATRDSTRLATRSCGRPTQAGIAIIRRREGAATSREHHQ